MLASYLLLTTYYSLFTTHYLLLTSLPTFVRSRADARLMIHRPSSVSAPSASTLPIVWSTVHEVLGRANPNKGSPILPHATAGGVGLVSILYSSWLDLPTIGTAGHCAKHWLLRQQVASSSSSRSAAAFAAQSLAYLRGCRLRVAVNSLSQDFISTTMGMLVECGCFQEIGKRGVWSRMRTAAAMTASSCCVDLAADIAHDLSWFNGLLAMLAIRLRRRVVHGLPLTSFPIVAAHAAFNMLKSGNNVGKVVLLSPFNGLVSVTLTHALPEVRGSAQLASDRCADEDGTALARVVQLPDVLRMSEQIMGCKVDADVPLMDAGIDSLGAIELRNQLQHHVGKRLHSSLVFNHPTLRQLAASQVLHISRPPYSSRSYVFNS